MNGLIDDRHRTWKLKEPVPFVELGPGVLTGLGLGVAALLSGEPVGLVFFVEEGLDAD